MSKRVTRTARDTPDSRPLLARILETPDLARVIPQLQPAALQRLIERCGLEDCGEVVGLATPAQLRGVFDLDLWRSARPGLDEQFDADRFGVWLEVLAESDPSLAAGTLAGLDVEFVTAALAQRILVFDPAAAPPPIELDGEAVSVDRTPDNGLSCEVGGYLVAARRPDAWDAVVNVMAALAEDHTVVFHRVMRGCRRLSNSTPEIDGLDNLLTEPDQVMFELTLDRERRREQQGYTTPAEARAFLQMSREVSTSQAHAPTANPVSAAYFRTVDEATTTHADDGAHASTPASASVSPSTNDQPVSAGASLVDVLMDEGVLAKPPRALLDGPKERERLELITAHMRFAQDNDPGAFMMRSQELAFLANTVMAGCSIQARPFTSQEASDAAIATCNLGLENWPAHWLAPSPNLGSRASDAALPDNFLVNHGLIAVFQVGWTVLHRQACMATAEQLVGVLSTLKCGDREIQRGLDSLRIELRKRWRAGTPWLAREALEVLTSLDMPAWATLLGLIDECPVIHAGLAASRGSGTRVVSASAFEFISENSQIAAVHEYMRALPVTLGG